MVLEPVTSFVGNNPGLIIAAVVIGVLLISGGLKLRRMMHVQKNGVVGTAVVSTLKETGRLQNHTPELSLELEVSLPGQASYRIEKKAVIPMIYYPRIQPGMTIEVIADPDKLHDPNYLGLRFHDGIAG